jgi:chromosome segregation ATPase
MAKSAEQRVYRMTLAQFLKYLGDKREELDACRQEIDEIQARFRKVFNDELAAWQELFSYCFPRVKEGRAELPADFRAYLDRIEAEEQARIRGEIADLEREVAEKRAAADRLTAQAQEAIGAMRAANPELNSREEEVKTRVHRLQSDFTLAFEEEDRLKSEPLGWLRHGRRIRRLGRVQKTTKAQQEQALQALRQVRKTWLDTVQSTSETQAALRQEWQQTTIRVSEAQGQRDYMAEQFDTLAEDAALLRALQDLNLRITVSGELGAKLKELAQHNAVRKSYEEGLTAVAEALGLLKGVSDGLGRFRESVGKVVAEQRRYNLKPVQVPVPHQAAAINAIWAELRQQVKNEDYMGSNPLQFVRIVKRHISEPLTNATIQAFFEGMGEALNQATKAWG